MMSLPTSNRLSSLILGLEVNVLSLSCSQDLTLLRFCKQLFRVFPLIVIGTYVSGSTYKHVFHLSQPFPGSAGASQVEPILVVHLTLVESVLSHFATKGHIARHFLNNHIESKTNADVCSQTIEER